MLLDKLDNQAERDWYAAEAVKNGWTRKVMLNQILARLHLRAAAAPTNFAQQLPRPVPSSRKSSRRTLSSSAVRAFNHQTGTRFATYRNEWNHVPDAYRCPGELTYLTSGLRQAIHHLSEAMQAQLELGYVGADAGSTYDGRPEQAIATARTALAVARSSAAQMHTEFDLA